MSELDREEVIRALEARERLLTGIIGSLESFFTVDAQWRCTFANQAGVALAGVGAEELLGRDVREFLPDDVREDVCAQLDVAMSERAVVTFRSKDSRDVPRIYDATAHPLGDGGLAIYARDVTRLEMGGAGTVDAERRYEELVESVNSAILRWSRDGNLTFFNEYAERLFGWRADEVLGRHVNFLLPDHDGERGDLSRLAGNVVAHPERYASNINENVRKDGSRLWMAWTNRALLDERGEVTEVLAVGNDVTELLTAQAALRESEEQYRRIVETSAEGIVLADPGGPYRFVNRRMCDMLGYPEEEILGRSSSDFTFEKAKPQVLEAHGNLPAGKVVSGEFRFRRRDGSELWSRFNATAVFDRDGRHVADLAMHMDVTEQRRAEQALREKEEERIAQEERSRLARDLHDSVTQALFAATMKTEALTLAADLLSAENVQAVEDVRRLNRGALAQMRTLLLELRGDPLEEVPVQQLLRHLVEAAEARSSANVLLTIRGDEKLPPELHVALYRITQEALTNVTRHARASKAWVDLDLEPGVVHLLVGDDGCGFDPSAVEAGRLGLKSMRERAAQVGAGLDVLSRPNDGTTVTLDWPVTPPSGSPAADSLQI